MTGQLLVYSYRNFSQAELRLRAQVPQAVGMTATLAVLLVVARGVMELF